MSLLKSLLCLAAGVSLTQAQAPDAARSPISDEVKKILLEARRKTRPESV